MPKLEISKEECLAYARHEGDAEIGAGKLAADPRLDGKCAGGEVPPLDGSQCAKCGATENDFCPYETQQ